MGGYLNLTDYCSTPLPYSHDYNLVADPVASSIVLQSGIENLILVGPQVTLQTWLTQEDIDRLTTSLTPYRDLLFWTVDVWPFGIDIFFKCVTILNYDFIHDPMTTATFLTQQFWRFEEYSLLFEEIDGVWRTMVVNSTDGNIATNGNTNDSKSIDRSKMSSNKKYGYPNNSTATVFKALCAIEVNGDAFKDFFVERLLRL